MAFLAQCPHCRNTNNCTTGVVTNCVGCAEPFICLESYCLRKQSSKCDCHTFHDTNFHVGVVTTLIPNKPTPHTLVSAKSEGFACLGGCGFAWGLDHAVIDRSGAGAKPPFEGVFVVALEHLNNQTIYHGTRWNLLDSIRKHGLQPPTRTGIKSHGFHSEGSLIYTGRDRFPAENHCDPGCVLEIDFTGYIAIAKMFPSSQSINRLFENLPETICGIQFAEDGRSIAMRSGTSLTVKGYPVPPAKEIGFFGRIAKWLGAIERQK
jgi:hypothetical protein